MPMLSRHAAPLLPASLSLVRLTVLLGPPAALAVAAGVYTWLMIGGMTTLPGMAPAMTMTTPTMPMSMPMPMPMAAGGAATPWWTPLWPLFAMWTAMMAAMMLPTAAPMLAAFARMNAAPVDAPRNPGVAVSAFAGGYVAVWTVFSLAASVVQVLLDRLAWLSPMDMRLAAAPLAGFVLVAAGVYQWLPLKQACLRQCRTPLGFLMTQWRDGAGGAFVMGWQHGVYCVGCCWALMALLFVGGVMNPFWIVALAAYASIEKILPGGETVARAVGVLLFAAGAWMIVAPG